MHVHSPEVWKPPIQNVIISALTTSSPTSSASNSSMKRRYCSSGALSPLACRSADSSIEYMRCLPGNIAESCEYIR